MKEVGSMPIYKYSCDKCGEITEEFRPCDDRNVETPCHCGGTRHREYTEKIGIEFVTHTGWARYRHTDGSVTHYRKHRNYVSPRALPEGK